MGNNGFFITFEGGDASGKSTQVRRLGRTIKKLGRPTVLLSEPGGISLGKKIRRIVKFSPSPISAESELLLFLASRAQLVREAIQPALENGEIVICDRFSDSTLAYQGFGRGLDLDLIRQLNQFSTNGLSPDVTILLDLDPSLAKKRRKASMKDRFESLNYQSSEGTVFFQKVREGYLTLAREAPDRWLIFDGSLPVSELTSLIWAQIHNLLKTN